MGISRNSIHDGTASTRITVKGKVIVMVTVPAVNCNSNGCNDKNCMMVKFGKKLKSNTICGNGHHAPCSIALIYAGAVTRTLIVYCEARDE